MPLPSETSPAATLPPLPVQQGFRLRGAEMTRLETFTDAAFAFAVTLLVISVDAVPTSYDELLNALRALPVFGLSFGILMIFWWGHHRWSRRFGLEDLPSVLLSLALVFTVLSYVYPLKYMWALVTWWLSDGVLAPEARLDSPEQVDHIIGIYSIGFTAMALLLAALNGWAWKQGDALELDRVERFETRGEIASWLLTVAVGTLSVLLAFTGLGPPATAGWIYMLLPAVMGVWTARFERRKKRLLEEEGGEGVAA